MSHCYALLLPSFPPTNLLPARYPTSYVLSCQNMTKLLQDLQDENFST